MVLMTGVEPVRGCPQGILSPVRLPIPPHQHIYQRGLISLDGMQLFLPINSIDKLPV